MMMLSYNIWGKIELLSAPVDITNGHSDPLRSELLTPLCIDDVLSHSGDLAASMAAWRGAATACRLSHHYHHDPH